MPSRPRSRLLCILFAFLVLSPSCTSTRKYESLLAEYRALEREHGETASGLSRDNAVLYEERIELEKRVSLLQNTIENLEERLAAEAENHRAYRKRTEQRVEDLEKTVQACEEKSSRKIRMLHRRHRATADSLIGQIDTLSARLAAKRKSHSAQVQTLKNELAHRRYEYEKELYALEKVKEELFGKLQEKEQKMQQLLLEAHPAADTTAETQPSPPVEAGADTAQADTAAPAP